MSSGPRPPRAGPDGAAGCNLREQALTERRFTRRARGHTRVRGSCSRTPRAPAVPAGRTPRQLGLGRRVRLWTVLSNTSSPVTLIACPLVGFGIGPAAGDEMMPEPGGGEPVDRLGAPGSSNRCVAPGMISRRFSQRDARTACRFRLNDLPILAVHDEQRGGLDVLERIGSEIGGRRETPLPRQPRQRGRRDQRCGRSGARAEISDLQRSRAGPLVTNCVARASRRASRNTSNRTSPVHRSRSSSSG